MRSIFISENPVKLSRFVVIGVLLVGSLWAQDSSSFDRVDLYGGYSFISQDTNNKAARQNMNGWEGSATLHLNRWFGVEGAVDGYYQNFSDVAGADVGANDYIFAAGPRFTFKPLFFHALFGVDRFTSYVNANGSIFAVSSNTSQNSFASVLGGGVEWWVGRRLAVRPSLDYVLTRRGTPSLTQNNIRLGIGLEYAFGH